MMGSTLERRERSEEEAARRKAEQLVFNHRAQQALVTLSSSLFQTPARTLRLPSESV